MTAAEWRFNVLFVDRKKWWGSRKGGENGNELKDE
jgi:hypothetical protein